MIKKINMIIGVLFVFLLLDIKYYINYDWKAKRMNNISNNTILLDDLPKEINDDIIGQLDIPGLNISCQLVQGLDNSFYLSHDIERKDSKLGAIFLDYQSDLSNSNISYIYGHSSLIYDLPFNNLSRYLNKSFLNNNNIISIHYLGNNINYKVVEAYTSTKRNKLSKNTSWLVLQTCNPKDKGKYIYVIAQKMF